MMARSTVENGKRKYNIKKMSFDVYNENRTALRNDPSARITRRYSFKSHFAG